MKLLEEVKSHSSKWIKTKGEAYRDFYWQDGYGTFSVTPNEINTVVSRPSKSRFYDFVHKSPVSIYKEVINK